MLSTSMMSTHTTLSPCQPPIVSCIVSFSILLQYLYNFRDDPVNAQLCRHTADAQPLQGMTTWVPLAPPLRPRPIEFAAMGAMFESDATLPGAHPPQAHIIDFEGIGALFEGIETAISEAVGAVLESDLALATARN